MRKTYKERKAEVIQLLQEFVRRVDNDEINVYNFLIQREFDTSFINKFGSIETHELNDWKLVISYQETSKEKELMKELGYGY